jgi:hypothetical protein
MESLPKNEIYLIAKYQARNWSAEKEKKERKKDFGKTNFKLSEETTGICVNFLKYSINSSRYHYTVTDFPLTEIIPCTEVREGMV